MIDFLKVINNLKVLTNSKNDAELSVKLGLNARAVANWKSRNTINLQKIIEFALSNNIDLNLLFKEDLSTILEDNIPSPEEEFVIFYLKRIKKLDKSKFLNILLNPTSNLLLRCLEHYNSSNNSLSKNNAKNILINLVKECNLSIWLDTEIKRKKLIEEIEEEFSNLECYVILKYKHYFLT